MSIVFEPSTHTYKSLIDPSKEWISATTLISYFKQPFDKNTVAAKCSKNKKSKWYKMPVDEILNAWKYEADRSCDMGTWYHLQREQDVVNCESIEYGGKMLKIVKPLEDETGLKIAPYQKITDGIYPEHFVYLNGLGICGQSDRVEVYDNFVTIVDYKTNRDISFNSYVNWEGASQKMRPPIDHLEDCNGIHYNLQLSLYMYMILKHNPQLKPGRLVIQHVIFEEEDQKDKYGYPIIKIIDNTPIVKEIKTYTMPYLKEDIQKILKYYEANKHTILNYKK